jgi:hypothetical protein
MIVANTEENAYPKAELHSTSAVAPARYTPPTSDLSAIRGNVTELAGNNTSPIHAPPVSYPTTPYPYTAAQNTNELAGTAIPPINAAELSGNDHWSQPQQPSNNGYWSHPQELGSEGAWSHTHELGSGAQSVYSDDRTLASEHRGRDEYLEELKAKRAAVAEERERLRRMEMLREEDERLEREIAEYEKMRGL